MADFRWNNIEAPRLDTRDLALAGQTLNSGFDRFSQILQARDAKLNKDATDAGAAQLLAAQDPAALAAMQAKAAAGGFGDRADLRELAVLGNQRGAQLTSQALDQSNLSLNQDKQAESNDLIKNGHLYQKALEAAGVGDHAGADAIFAQVRAAGGGQAAASVTKDLMDQFSGFRKYELDKRQTDSTIANDAARTGFAGAELGMARTTFNQGQQERQAKIDGDVMGVNAATALRVLDPTTAESKFHESPEYTKATPAGKAQADASFKTAYGQLTGTTGSINQEFAGQTSKINAMQSSLDAAGNRAKNAQLTTLAKDTRTAATDQPDLGMKEAVAAVKPLIPGWSTKSGLDTDLKKIMSDVPGARLEDITTAAKSTLNAPGFWNSVLPGDNGALDELTRVTKDIVDNRAKGYGQNLELDLAKAVAPSAAVSAEITQLQAEQVRWERAKAANAPGMQTKAARDAHAAAEARLLKLLGSSQSTQAGNTGSW